MAAGSKTKSVWAKAKTTVESFSSFIKEIRKLGPEHKTHYWFRGQSNHKWDLEPSFLRITGGLKLSRSAAVGLERAARDEFKSKAHLYVKPHLLEKVKTNPCWWAVMQHHGAPTRLLDWSTSPYVAAYFAAQQDGSCKNGTVWCFCSRHLKEKFEEKYRKHLRAKYGKSYEKPLPDFTESKAKDPKVGLLHKCLRDPDAIRVVVPLTFPFASSERIAKQQSRFTMCLRIHQQHNCLSELIPKYVKKIVIPFKKKPHFLAELRRMNITASAMFPGVDGLGRSVAEFAALGGEWEELC